MAARWNEPPVVHLLIFCRKTIPKAPAEFMTRTPAVYQTRARTRPSARIATARGGLCTRRRQRDSSTYLGPAIPDASRVRQWRGPRYIARDDDDAFSRARFSLPSGIMRPRWFSRGTQLADISAAGACMIGNGLLLLAIGWRIFLRRGAARAQLSDRINFAVAEVAGLLFIVRLDGRARGKVIVWLGAMASRTVCCGGLTRDDFSDARSVSVGGGG